MASTSANVSDYCICDLCDVHCKSQDDWNDHNKLAHEKKEKEYTCNICDYISRDRSNLASHIEVAHFSESYNCVICNIKGLSNYQYIAHQDRHRSLDKYKCFCKQNFDYFSLLIAHHKEAHSDIFFDIGWNKGYKCNDCKYTSFYNFKMNIHKSSMHSSEIFTCVICDIVLVSKHKYHEHRQSEHTLSENLKNFICNVCKKQFREFWRLTRHHKTHLSAGKVAPYTCNICHAVHEEQTALDKHMDDIHSNVHSFRCYICRYRYRVQSTLDTHIKQKHPEQT